MPVGVVGGVVPERRVGENNLRAAQVPRVGIAQVMIRGPVADFIKWTQKRGSSIRLSHLEPEDLPCSRVCQYRS